MPEGVYRVPIGKARVARPGSDVTVAAVGHMTLEATRAAEMLAHDGISTEVIDVRTLRPLDDATILESVRKTGRLVVADGGWSSVGFAAEVVARVTEQVFDALKCPPRRVTLPDCPTPSCPALANGYYPRATHIAEAARVACGRTPIANAVAQATGPLDVPDVSFTGPF